MKRSLISMIVATTLTTAAYAGDMDTDSTSNKWEKGAKDAWIDGKAEATLLFNGNLDSFDINNDEKKVLLIFLSYSLGTFVIIYLSLFTSTQISYLLIAGLFVIYIFTYLITIKLKVLR